MIVCGELIDSTLCVMFNLSTMAAAAIGNTISDVAGIFSGGAVESLAMSFGVQEPPLTDEQRLHPVTRTRQYTGQVVGIVIGCMLGCCPLLWLDPTEAERRKRERERDQIFQSVINKVSHILGAEAVMLMFVDKERGELVSSGQTPNLPQNFAWKLTDGFIGHAATTGQYVNIADVEEEALYAPELHDNFLGAGFKMQSVLCLPLLVKGEVQ